MTRLKLLNVFVLQWGFVRLGRMLNDDGEQIGWALIGPVLPLTGWRSNFIGRPRAIWEWPKKKL